MISPVANERDGDALCILGTGFFCETYESAADYLAGTKKAEPTSSPRCQSVPPRMRRATSAVCRTLYHAAELACETIDASQVAIIFGSFHGEIDVALIQMEMMLDGDGQISPARFKNSVHNTSSGLFSIVKGNRGFATSIAAGDDTLGACLFEAYGLLAQECYETAVVAVAEERMPEPLDRFSQHVTGGAAFALSLQKHTPKSAAVLARMSKPTFCYGDSVFCPGDSEALEFPHRSAFDLLARLELRQVAGPAVMTLGPSWRTNVVA